MKDSAPRETPHGSQGRIPEATGSVGSSPAGAANDYSAFLAAKLSSAPATGIPGARVEDEHLFPFQRDLVTWALRRGRAALFADTGLGKAIPVDHDVLTVSPSGTFRWSAMGNIRVGDHVVSERGRPVVVTGVYPQGQRDVFRVRFDDGAESECDGEHLWTVTTDQDLCASGRWRTITLNEIVRRGLRLSGGRLRWRLPIARPVRGRKTSLAIDPYVLGVLLGDGYLRKGADTASFSSADPFIAEEVARRVSNGVRVRPETGAPGRCPSYRLAILRSGSGGRRNPIVRVLRKHGLLHVGSKSKWIPDEYLRSSIQQRMDLLRGLLDTDGYADPSGGVDFNTSSIDLASDVVSLVRSLGGVARSHEKIPTYTHRGIRFTGSKHYRIRIQLPPEVGIPFLLPRKAARFVFITKYQPMRKIEAVESVGVKECVCISVDSESGLFLLKDYVVTHNTRMQLTWAREVQRHTGGRVLILAPLSVAKQTAAEGEACGIAVTRAFAGMPDDPPGIYVTNYDKLHKFEDVKYDAVVLDESSVIKHYNSKTFPMLLERFGSVPFKLACSATPSPNDYLELGTHAEFLGVCSRSEMMSEFFWHDQSPGDELTKAKWRLKRHARTAFWRWVSAWAALLRSPADLGYDGSAYILPELRVYEHRSDADHESTKAAGLLFAEPASTLTERRNARRDTMAIRIRSCVSVVRDAPQDQWVVWCEFNAEQDALAKEFGDACVSIQGKQDSFSKELLYEQWQRGEKRILVSKPSIFGFGINMQFCARMAFVGVTDSYESYYQATRRIWRFGQKRACDIHIFYNELEGDVLKNLQRKGEDARKMGDELSAETREMVQAQVRGATRETNAYESRGWVMPEWLTRREPDVEAE